MEKMSDKVGDFLRGILEHTSLCRTVQDHLYSEFYIHMDFNSDLGLGKGSNQESEI